MVQFTPSYKQGVWDLVFANYSSSFTPDIASLLYCIDPYGSLLSFSGVETVYELSLSWPFFYQFRNPVIDDVLSVIPFFESYFLGVSLVFMLLYVWSREFPNANINIYGLVQLKAFYLPWAMLAMDVIFGSPIGPDLCGIIAGHMYYFLTVLHPLAGGKFILQTPKWVHKIVARYRIGAPAYTPPQPASSTSGAFRGRSYRVGG
ncbi:hypothetical protein M8C21_019688 [Ambrosia artemisiifolia]|uniref:Derlin n=1 Tax=Ambrosia artemisiifolia TaxID=4212 RepID=A0AAD5G779_AMBAR|nr:hypothetical protein M8C21_019688 [Ambrosia artemisiifolia]